MSLAFVEPHSGIACLCAAAARHVMEGDGAPMSLAVPLPKPITVQISVAAAFYGPWPNRCVTSTVLFCRAEALQFNT